jgi:hypothetical protein
MPHPPPSTHPARSSCRVRWCDGRCDQGDGEFFHRTSINVEASYSGEVVGVELVRNDNPDGDTAGPYVDITYSQRGLPGLSNAVTSLGLDAARRHALAVLRAVKQAAYQEA